MDKSVNNLVEIGINLIIAVAVVAIFMSMIGVGRATAVSIENEKRQKNVFAQQVEFGDLNGKIVTYAEAVELITNYAGSIDLYVDSTCDGGAILISSKISMGKEDWTTVTKSTKYSLNTAYNIGGATGYTSPETQMRADVQTLLSSDLSSKFGMGGNSKWKVCLAINQEFVGNCTGTVPTANDTVTGIRLIRQ